MRRASLKEGAARGTIMNSWKSRPLSAWRPPLRMFIRGTGRVVASSPPRYRNRGTPRSAAAARATARETPRIALAPRRLLLGVPSRSQSIRSMPRWSDGSRPRRRGARTSRTFRTALRTPRPPYRVLSPSRSSSASWTPVLAPEGTAATPRWPVSRDTSTSTVGLPRESRISRAVTWTIVPISTSACPPQMRGAPPRRRPRPPGAGRDPEEAVRHLEGDDVTGPHPVRGAGDATVERHPPGAAEVAGQRPPPDEAAHLQKLIEAHATGRRDRRRPPPPKTPHPLSA